MKNNLILGFQGFKKMLKGMLLLAVSLMVVGVDARGPVAGRKVLVRKQVQPTPTPVVGGGTIAQQQVANRKAQLVDLLLQQAKITRNNLSPEGIIIVRDVEAGYDWEPLWDKYIERTQNVSEKSFLTELRSSLVKKKQKIEESSIAERALQSLNAQNRQLMKEIGGLRQQLSLQNKGLLGYLYESVAAAGPALGISGGSGTLAWLLGGLTLGGSAAVGLSVLGLASGLSYVAEKVRTGEFTDAVARLVGENVITQYINDNGRYPTFDSRIDGINKDILNTSTLDNNAFENYRKTVLSQTIAKQKEAFEDVAVKESEGKIDAQIRLIRDKHFNEDPAIYMRNLEGIKNIENITQATAIISEYLRAGFREGQIKLLENKKDEEQKKVKEQPKQSSWWSLLGY